MSFTLEASVQQSGIYVNSNDNFGYSVAMSADGTRVIVGAYQDEYNNIYTGTPNYTNSGRAYIFVRSDSSWILEAELQQPAEYVDAGDNFGFSVAISGDGTRVIVGAYLDEYNNYLSAPNPNYSASGRAYIYLRSGSSWALEASLQQPDGYVNGNDQFGYSVAMSGDGTRVIVGAFFDEYNNDTSNYNDSGRAYIFLRTGSSWTLEAELQQPSEYVTDGDRFGASVAISGDGTRVIVGASNDEYNNYIDVPNPNYEASGRAYIFSRLGSLWSLEASLQQPAEYADFSDVFGISVAISGDGNRVIVGARGDEYNNLSDTSYFSSGRAYIFVRIGSSWTPEADLQQPGQYASSNDNFGRSVAISGDGSRVIVGALNDDYDTYGSNGRAYIFSRVGSSWALETSLQQSSEYITNGDQFGVSVAMSGDGTRVIVGAYLDEYNNYTGNPNTDPNYSSSGRAYIFLGPPLPSPPLFFRKLASSRDTLLMGVST